MDETISLKDLIIEQNNLRKKLNLIDSFGNIEIIAGCDSALIDDKIISVFINFSFPDLEILEIKHHASKLEFPYIPGFLSFREIPNILKTYSLLENTPDLIMVDGHGVAHPRSLGIAAHLGIVLNKPTIGVAKNKLVGEYNLPAEAKGSVEDLFYKGQKIGYVLRSKDKVKPIFVSPGNNCSFGTALYIVLQTLRKHKLPEPTRLADFYSKKLKSEYIL